MHATDMEIGIGIGEDQRLSFFKRNAINWIFSLYWKKTTGNAKVKQGGVNLVIYGIYGIWNAVCLVWGS